MPLVWTIYGTVSYERNPMKRQLIQVFYDEAVDSVFVIERKHDTVKSFSKDIIEQEPIISFGIGKTMPTHKLRFEAIDNCKIVSMHHKEVYKFLASLSPEAKRFYDSKTALFNNSLLKKEAMFQAGKATEIRTLYSEYQYHRDLRKLHSANYQIHGSDIPPKDYAVFKWIVDSTNDPSVNNAFPLRIATLDIEVDSIQLPDNRMPEEDIAPSPINVISVAHDDVVLLFYKNTYELDGTIHKYSTVKLDKNKMLHEINLEYLNNAGLEHEPKNYRTKVLKLIRCETELEIIEKCFKYINTEEFDIVACWNMRFDIITIKNRLMQIFQDDLQEDMYKQTGQYRRIMLHPELYARGCRLWKFKKDSINDPCDRSDFLDIASKTIFIDAMLLYAALRKNKKKPSYKLNAILAAELKEQKIEYDCSFKEFPRKHYQTFLTYSAVDSTALLALLRKTSDLELAYNLSLTTGTSINLILKKTISLKNFMRIKQYGMGFLLSNTPEMPSSVKMKAGAFVGDPMLIDKDDPDGTLIFKDVIDFDLEALYPSILINFNIDSETEIGRILLDNKDDDTAIYPVIQTLASNDIIGTGKFFNLPSLTEWMDYLQAGKV